MLTPGIAQLHNIRRAPASQSLGITVGRGASSSSYKPQFEDEYTEHQQRLEDIRLVGYRYLKPPGVTKTLRAIHEDEAFAAGSSTEDNSMYSEAMHGETSTPTGRIEDRMGRSEDNSMLEEENEDEGEVLADDAPDFSLPALNASFPSMYYQQ